MVRALQETLGRRGEVRPRRAGLVVLVVRVRGLRGHPMMARVRIPQGAGLHRVGVGAAPRLCGARAAMRPMGHPSGAQIQPPPRTRVSAVL